MLKCIFVDRRVWLVGLLLLLVGLVARWALPPERAFRWVVFGGYWFVLALVFLCARAVAPAIREGFRARRLGRFDLWVLIGTFFCAGIWVAHEKPGFKILADEVVLLGTSMGMHYQRAAAYPVRATDVQGPFQILERLLDKRPLLFPFLTATVHDITGYRPENPFYLNMGLSVVFLWLAYLLGWAAGNDRWAGVLMALLFAGLPLMALQAVGGGFELLNLLLITALALLAIRYLQDPEERKLEAVVYGALLLSSTRYESVIFLLPAAAAVIWGWQRAGRVILSWPAIFSPLFLFPILIQNRVFADESMAWEMASVPGATEPFGFQYLASNLGHALAFFFDFSGYQPSSAIFAAAGLAAVPLFGLWIVRVFREPSRQNPTSIALGLVGVSLYVVTAIYLLYFWGQFDHPVIHRLSLPVHLLMAIAIVVIGAGIVRSTRGWKIACFACVGGMLFQGIPAMAKRAYARDYPPGVEMEFRREFLARAGEPDFLFIDNDSVFWITHKIPATPAKLAQARKEGLAYHLKNHSFSAMYVFQSMLVDEGTGVLFIDPADDLGPAFELETVLERRIQALLFARISRVTAIRQGAEVLARATTAVPTEGGRRTADELDKARALYLQNWIKKLP